MPKRVTKTSKLEHALLLGHTAPGQFRHRLFEYLDDGSSLANLRLCSRALRDIVSWRLCRNLYMRAPIAPIEGLVSLVKVAKYCDNLTILVEKPEPAAGGADFLESMSERGGKAKLKHRREPTRPPASATPDRSELALIAIERYIRSTAPRSVSSSRTLPPSAFSDSEFSGPSKQSLLASKCPQHVHRHLWIQILSQFQMLQSITLRIKGNPGWPGLTEIEDTLISLRIAIEYAELVNLRTVNLNPIHAMGIIHLRWSGLGAFGECPAPGALTWQKLHTLDIRIRNPFIDSRLSPQQETMFKKILYDYLRSMAPTLLCLRFVWLDAEGSSPLMLHQEPDLAHEELDDENPAEDRRDPILWPRLKELWLGNIRLPHQTIRSALHFVPNLTCLKTLRSTHRYTRARVDEGDSSAWVEVMLEMPEVPEVDEPSSQTSSLYSQLEFPTRRNKLHRISSKSRVVPFMLDIGGVSF